VLAEAPRLEPESATMQAWCVVKPDD